MKKSILLTLSLLLVAFSASAQSNSINVGLTGGITRAKLDASYESVESYENRTGFTEGLSFQFNFKKTFSLYTGVWYSQKRTTTIYSVYHITFKDDFEFLTMPLLLRATFGSKINFFVNAGPYWGILLKRMRTENFYPGFEYDVDLTDMSKKIEFGISGGIGTSINFKEGLVVSLEGKVEKGLNDIDSGPNEVTSGALLILAGVAYRFGSRENDAK